MQIVRCTYGYTFTKTTHKIMQRYTITLTNSLDFYKVLIILNKTKNVKIKRAIEAQGEYYIDVKSFWCLTFAILESLEITFLQNINA